ncbi:hypothetical protein JMJ77_0011993, partial [Colletotrichum scovillei]
RWTKSFLPSFAASPRKDATRRAILAPGIIFPRRNCLRQILADHCITNVCRQYPISSPFQASAGSNRYFCPYQGGNGANDYLECSHLSHHLVSAARLEAADG